ncbi:MAG: aldolase/citrate lyase family protein, partial [Patulibacter sp.]
QPAAAAHRAAHPTAHRAGDRAGDHPEPAMTPDTAAGPGRLPHAAVAAIDAHLAAFDAWSQRRYPGGSQAGQPLHTVYIPADRATPGCCAQWGHDALDALDAHGSTPQLLAAASGLPEQEVADAWPLLRAALSERPIHDLRVDLEDGYGPHSDAEEDADTDRAAATLLAESAAPNGPRRCGIRHRSLEQSTRHRAVRTLDRLLGRLTSGGGELPRGFVVTLPKVVDLRQVEAYVELLGALERAHGIAQGAVRFEIQVETPQTILAADGRLVLAPMLEAADGRCTGLHFGTYDYTAALGVPAAEQHARHGVARFAKEVMRLAAAGTGVEVSDGSINRLPVGDRDAVHAGWRAHAELVSAALADGIPQGWDLHPAQLVTRHLAVICAARRGLADNLQRLAAYLAAAAPPAGDDRGGHNAPAAPSATLDEPATAQTLAAGAVRAAAIGAATQQELEAATGVSLAALIDLAGRRVA